MESEIREAILGHSSRQRSVRDRYGFLADQELREAIDAMTFDHGDTVILVATGTGKKKRTDGIKTVSNHVPKKKGHGVRDLTFDDIQ